MFFIVHPEDTQFNWPREWSCNGRKAEKIPGSWTFCLFWWGLIYAFLQVSSQQAWDCCGFSLTPLALQGHTDVTNKQSLFPQKIRKLILLQRLGQRGIKLLWAWTWDQDDDEVFIDSWVSMEIDRCQESFLLGEKKGIIGCFLSSGHPRMKNSWSIYL